MLENVMILRKLLQEGYELLIGYKVEGWANHLMRLKADLDRIQNNEQLSLFLSANSKDLFGGMGSLYDIVICRENGNIANDFGKANRVLESYRKRFAAEWNRLMLNSKKY